MGWQLRGNESLGTHKLWPSRAESKEKPIQPQIQSNDSRCRLSIEVYTGYRYQPGLARTCQDSIEMGGLVARWLARNRKK